MTLHLRHPVAPPISPLTATPASPTGTGTGATAAMAATSGAATTLTPNTTADGTNAGQPVWTLYDSTGPGPWHDGGAATSTGFMSRLQVPLAPGSSLTVTVEANSTESDVGTTTLATFEITDSTDLDQLSQDVVSAAGTFVDRYVRYNITAIEGTFAIAVLYARESY